MSGDRRVAMVTGVSRGIGKATAALLRSQGVVTVGLARHIQDAASEVACDVGDEQSVARAFQEVRRRYGRVDILVNCAGSVTAGEPLSATVEEWETVLRVNLIGTYLCCKHALGLMREQHQGFIVNVSSIAGRSYSSTASLPYTCSKYAVIGLTRQLAARYGREGVRINCVCPSQTLTPMLVDNVAPDRLEGLARAHPLGRLADPSDVARAIVMLTGDQVSYVNGAVLDVNGGLL